MATEFKSKTFLAEGGKTSWIDQEVSFDSEVNNAVGVISGFKLTFGGTTEKEISTIQAEVSDVRFDSSIVVYNVSINMYDDGGSGSNSIDGSTIGVVIIADTKTA